MATTWDYAPVLLRDDSLGICEVYRKDDTVAYWSEPILVGEDAAELRRDLCRLLLALDSPTLDERALPDDDN